MPFESALFMRRHMQLTKQGSMGFVASMPPPSLGHSSHPHSSEVSGSELDDRPMRILPWQIRWLAIRLMGPKRGGRPLLFLVYRSGAWPLRPQSWIRPQCLLSEQSKLKLHSPVEPFTSVLSCVSVECIHLMRSYLTCIFYPSALKVSSQEWHTVTSITIAPFFRCNSLSQSVFRSRHSVASAWVRVYPFELTPGESWAIYWCTGASIAWSRASLILATSTFDGYLSISYLPHMRLRKLTTQQVRSHHRIWSADCI